MCQIVLNVVYPPHCSTQSLLYDFIFSLESDSPVVTFDKENKLMKINYDGRLVNFTHEVDVLSSMGFKIAPQIVKNAKLAENFMQQAKDLEEVHYVRKLSVSYYYH